MGQNWRALFCGLLLTINFITPANAQEDSVLGLVDECDILAAHPDDAERLADGVADDQIVPKLAIIACENAQAENPSEPRFQFQLGRALLAANKKEQALENFKKAADAGYSASWAYLGDAYHFGFGVPVDAKKAFAAYKKSLDGGFVFAKRQIEQLQFAPTMYTGEFLALFFSLVF